MHLKRNEMPKTWPIPRKGTTFIAKADHAKTQGIPLIFILRDILKLATTKKEARFFLLSGDVKVNNRVRKSEKFPMQVFDTISIEKIGKSYKLNIHKKRFKLEEVSGKDADKKIITVIGKKILANKKIQMNLEDGTNYLYDKEFALGDSAVLNTKKNEIEAILPLKKGANVEIVSGKHAGERGKLEEVVTLARTRKYKIKLKNKEVELPLKTLLVVE
jgi:small subunit ribosomal protein S4e